MDISTSLTGNCGWRGGVVVEEILDSRMLNWKLCYLVKWEGFGVEHNSWEPWDNVHVPELVVFSVGSSLP